MKMQRVLINFPPTHLKEIKSTAAAMGLTFPELVRISVAHWSVCDDGQKALRRKVADRVLKYEPETCPHGEFVACEMCVG